MVLEREVLEDFPELQIDPGLEATAQRIHRETMIVDTCNTAEWDDDYVIDRLAPSGVNVIVKTIASQTDYAETGSQIAPWFAKMRRYAKFLGKATDAREVDAVVADGRVAVIYALQNSKPLDEDIELIEVYYELGVRVIQLTYNYRGLAGDGCVERRDGGLSDWGVRLIEAMNDLGIVVDASHASPLTALDAIEVSRYPVILSHSNARAVVNNNRNVPDEVIKALGAKGGYMGLAVFLPMITEDRDRTPALEEFLAHIDHVNKIAGPGVVGFGLDRGEGRTLQQYSGFKFPTSTFPTWEQRQRHLMPEIRSVSQFINLTRALVARGHSEEEIKGILGGNFMRVFRQVTDRQRV
jgi:membrane dipeptidase